MKAYISFLVLVLAGISCASHSTVEQQKVQTLDLTFQDLGLEMRTNPVPYQNVTPYDANPTLRTAFTNGFKFGWDVAINQGLGALVSPPEEYQKSEQLRKAWREGYEKSQRTVYLLATNMLHNKLGGNQ